MPVRRLVIIWCITIALSSTVVADAIAAWGGINSVVPLVSRKVRVTWEYWGNDLQYGAPSHQHSEFSARGDLFSYDIGSCPGVVVQRSLAWLDSTATH